MSKEPNKPIDILRDLRIFNTAVKIATNPSVHIINNTLYIQGKVLNKIRERISEIYMQYETDPDKYNPNAIFPEEINCLDFVEEVFFPLFFMQMKPFKIVVGMKLEELPIVKEVISNNHIAFQCDNDNCKTRIVSSNPKIQDSMCDKCINGKMKSVDFENTEFKNKEIE